MFLTHSCSSHRPEVMGRALVGYLFDNITPFQLSSLSELALTKVTNSLCEPELNDISQAWSVLSFIGIWLSCSLPP